MISDSDDPSQSPDEMSVEGIENAEDEEANQNAGGGSDEDWPGPIEEPELFAT
jgi:hypothetical protein